MKKEVKKEKIMIKFSTAEKKLIKEIADYQSIPMSTFCRMVSVDSARKMKNVLEVAEIVEPQLIKKYAKEVEHGSIA